MQTIVDLLNAVQKIDIPYLVSNALYESAEGYVRLQREQMMTGLREDGMLIFNLKTGSDQYSKSYAKKKGKTSPIDLYDTGDFQGAIFLHNDDATTFVVDSADGKSGKLQENYGKQIFGLDDDNKVQLKPIVQENLYNDFVNELNK